MNSIRKFRGISNDLYYLDFESIGLIGKRIVYVLYWYGVDTHCKSIIDSIYSNSAKYIAINTPFRNCLQFNLGDHITDNGSIGKNRAVVSKYYKANIPYPFCFENDINGRLLMLIKDNQSHLILYNEIISMINRMCVKNKKLVYELLEIK